MYYSSILILLFFSCLSCSKIKPSNIDITFDYNIPIAPQSLDPILQRGIQARYLLNHIHRTLYKWDSKDNLVLSAAESCDWEGLEFICKLKKGLYFQVSDVEVKAKHYIFSLELIKENQKNDLLDFKTMSVYAKDEYTLVFKLNKKSKSFVYKLAQIEISPRPEKKLYPNMSDYFSSGTYKIEEIKKNQKIRLKHISKDLFVNVHFIEDQSTALRMYERQELDLLTLIPVREFEKYKNSDQIFHVPMSRMDGIFFNSSMDLNFKKALFHALDFKELQKLYFSIGVPGCPALPEKLYEGTYCYDFNLSKAKSFLKNSTYKKERIVLSFSSLGGDDIQRGMEWMAYEWKKNLNLNVSIEPLETGIFLNKIKTKSFDIIRKGLPLDSPKCLDGLVQFQSLNPNNINNFKNEDFDNHLKKLEAEPDLKELCDSALKILHENYVYLPLGNMYFSFLQNHRFTGWKINSLNIVDVEDLKRNF